MTAQLLQATARTDASCRCRGATAPLFAAGALPANSRPVDVATALILGAASRRVTAAVPFHAAVMVACLDDPDASRPLGVALRCQQSTGGRSPEVDADVDVLPPVKEASSWSSSLSSHRDTGRDERFAWSPTGYTLSLRGQTGEPPPHKTIAKIAAFHVGVLGDPQAIHDTVHRGVRLYQPSEPGDTAVYEAAAKYLRYSALLGATAGGHVDVVEWLLRQDASLRTMLGAEWFDEDVGWGMSSVPTGGLRLTSREVSCYVAHANKAFPTRNLNSDFDFFLRTQDADASPIVRYFQIDNALGMALRFGQMSVVDYFLSIGPATAYTSANATNPMQSAIAGRHAVAVRRAIQIGFPICGDDIEIVCRSNTPEIFDLLVREIARLRGVTVNEVAAHPVTTAGGGVRGEPRAHACAGSNIDILRALVTTYGVPLLSPVTYQHMTPPIHLQFCAVHSSNAAFLRLLEDLRPTGTSVEEFWSVRGGASDYRVIDYAAYYSSPDDVFQFLLERSAGGMIDPVTGRTPLFYAQHLGVLRRLIETFGVDVNHQDHAGWTALHFAASNAIEAQCVGLKQLKARRDIKDARGSIPADLATTPALRDLLKPSADCTVS